MALVSLTQAQGHLRLPITTDEDTSDPDLVMKLAHAEAIVLDWLMKAKYPRTAILAWTAATIPFPATAAILLQLGELYRFRGDDLHDQGPLRESSLDLSPVIIGLLRRLTDPVLQ